LLSPYLPLSPPLLSPPSLSPSHPSPHSTFLPLALPISIAPPAPSPFNVGIIICEGPGDNTIQSTLIKALSSIGVVNIFVEKCPHYSALPTLARQLLRVTDGVIACEIIYGEGIGGSGFNSANTLSTTLSDTLSAIGEVEGNKPIVAGLVVQSSLIEARGVLPLLTQDWSLDLLTQMELYVEENREVRRGEIDVSAFVPVASVPEKEESEAEILLKAFKEGLKVRVIMSSGLHCWYIGAYNMEYASLSLLLMIEICLPF
jgi:hypothetical protein